MRLFRFLLSALIFVGVASAAQAAAPIHGQDYLTLDTPQSTIPGKKVEIIEFFAYYCPHCNALDAPLAEWVKAQGDNIVFKRVHTSVTGEAVPQQRLYYTLESMGKVEEFHTKILFAIHAQKKQLDTDDEIADFMAGQGIDRQKFVDAYHSFSVQSKVTRALQMQNAYEVHTWPTIILDGRYVTAPPMAAARMDPYNENLAQNMMLKVMDELVLQLKNERSK